jgi:hypothetical protein
MTRQLSLHFRNRVAGTEQGDGLPADVASYPFVLQAGEVLGATGTADLATPYGYAAADLAARYPASTTVAGMVELATTAEVRNNTALPLAVTSQTLIQNLGVAKAWVDGNENATTMAASYNIASQADTGVGIVTYTYSTAFFSANYALIPGITGVDASPDAADDAISVWVASKTAGGCVLTTSIAGSPWIVDPGQWYFAAFGDQ